MIKILRFFAVMLLFAVSGGMWAQDETIDMSAQGYANGDKITSVAGVNATVTFTGGTTPAAYYDAGTAIRIYGAGAFTVASATKSIAKLVFTFSGTYAPTTSPLESVSAGSYDYSTKTWTSSAASGDASVTFTRVKEKGHWRLQKIDVYYAGDDSRIPITLTFSSATASAVYGDGSTFTVPTLMIDPSGVDAIASAITYSSSNTKVAAVDVSTGAVTLAGSGTTNITAHFAGNADYLPATASYALTVTHHGGAKGTLQNPFTVAEVIKGDANDKGKIYVRGYIVGSYGSGHAIVSPVASNIALGDTPDVTNGVEAIPVEMGSKSVMRTPMNAADNPGMVGVKVIVRGDGTAYYGVNGVKNIDEGYIVQTITNTQYATMYFSNANLKVPAGVTVNTYTVSGGKIVPSKNYVADATVPAGEAVVLNGKAGDYNFMIDVAPASAKDANNQLLGTDTETALNADANSYFYWLSTNAAGDPASVGFYWGAEGGAAFTNGAHKAYLKVAKSAGAKSAYLFNETTGIHQIVNNGRLDMDAPMYNVAGQRVGKNYRGVVLQNGKKFILR